MRPWVQFSPLGGGEKKVNTNSDPSKQDTTVLKITTKGI
jgi:hypothetical protein